MGSSSSSASSSSSVTFSPVVLPDFQDVARAVDSAKFPLSQVRFSPVMTMPTAVKITGGGFTRTVAWSALPGATIGVPAGLLLRVGQLNRINILSVIFCSFS